MSMRINIYLICMSVIFILIGCGNPKAGDKAENITPTVTMATTKPTAMATVVPTITTTIKPTLQPTSNKYINKLDLITDYTLLNGIGIFNETTKSKAEKILGKNLETKFKEQDFSEEVPWNFERVDTGEGLVITFTYEKKDDKDPMVGALTITSPKFPTSRGIKVGDFIENVKRAYGEQKVHENGRLNYGGDEPASVAFEIKDNIVKKIIIYSEH